MPKDSDKEQVEIRLNLPGSLVREAKATGLLEPQSMESMLREMLRQKRVDQLFEAAGRLAAVPLPPLTEAELAEEIAAVRSAHARGR